MRKGLVLPKSFQEMKTLTVMNLSFKLLRIFEHHIGQDNAISKQNLFKKVYQHPMQENLQDELRWDYLRRAMHFIRVRTQCFIASRNNKHYWDYFVVSDYRDAQCYIDTLDRNIKAMNHMKKRVMVAVEQKWHKQPQAWIPMKLKLLEEKE